MTVALVDLLYYIMTLTIHYQTHRARVWSGFCYHIALVRSIIGRLGAFNGETRTGFSIEFESESSIGS